MPFFTTTDGCNLYYTTYGLDPSKPAIVFLNGTTQTTLYWGNQVPAFSEDYGLLFYDARGQGQSDPGHQPMSPGLHVSDLRQLLLHLNLARANLVGISHGARIALEFALQHPELVRQVVLCSTSARTSPRCRAIVRSWLEIIKLAGLKSMAWAALPSVFGNQFLKHHMPILDKIVDAVDLRNNRKALEAQLEAVLKYPPIDRVLAKYDIPTLLITGSEDPLIEWDHIQELAHRCRARHEQLAGVGHSIPSEAPKVFQKLVLEFLGKNK
jgi:pimeloyl-ACP methyl ester carboxylesterase